MNDKIATAFLTTLGGAMVVGILYIAFVPIPEGPARNSQARNSKEACGSGTAKGHAYACIEKNGPFTWACEEADAAVHSCSLVIERQLYTGTYASLKMQYLSRGSHNE